MKKVIISALLLSPAFAFAQTVVTTGSPNLNTLQTLLTAVGRLVNTALPIVIAIGLLVFLWGLVKFIFAGSEAKEEGKTMMIWGIVALFVMVSVWGLVRFIGGAVGIGQGGTIPVPTVERLP